MSARTTNINLKKATQGRIQVKVGSLKKNKDCRTMIEVSVVDVERREAP
jgi:hypothetical protein